MNVETVCRDQHRRERVRRFSNGIDYVDAGEDRQTLTVHFFNALPGDVRPEHFRISGGADGRPPRIVSVSRSERTGAVPDKALDLGLSGPADLAPYLLTMTGVSGIDPLYASVGFSFGEQCAALLDCLPSDADAAASTGSPRIDYLAKDYASFRQLMLDRLATTMPGWTERHVPDLGIAIVEVFAYVADYLSYYQDAVATEAYLGTARRRVSVRRHARLVDYVVHEGCNARAWLHLRATAEDRSIDLADTFVITSCRATGDERTALLRAEALELVPETEYEVFEPVLDARTSSASVRFEVVAAHNEMRFYTWGSRTCWLRQGATSATLLDAWVDDKASDPEDANASETLRTLRRLAVGDILILEERLSATTGSAADADRSHRHAVRLTSVERIVDPLYGGSRGRPLVTVAWAAADALPFDLCLATLGPAPECRFLGPDPDRVDSIDMAVALGNVILVDHGRTVREAPEAWTVPIAEKTAGCESEGQLARVRLRAGRLEPVLARKDPTFRTPLPRAPRSAADLLRQTPQSSLPAVVLHERRPDRRDIVWSPRIDLLDSDPIDQHFVVEIDDERVARIRLGGAPWPGSRFSATYRVGNGEAGNVGAESLRHVVSRAGVPFGIEVRNPLPARGGVDPESTADAKVRAPDAFRRSLERAITADDYARLAEQHPDVQRAAAQIARAGSRHAVVVAIDPLGRVRAEPTLPSEVKRSLFRYRRIGHDLRVVPAAYAALRLTLRVCLKDGYVRGHVERALLDAFSARRLPGGALGFFHPDRLTFGQSVFSSQILATAQGVAGVDSVAIVIMQRVGDGNFKDDEHPDEPGIDDMTAAVLRAGVLPIGPFEIARLDNDPNHPEWGVLDLDIRGGR